MRRDLFKASKTRLFLFASSWMFWLLMLGSERTVRTVTATKLDTGLIEQILISCYVDTSNTIASNAHWKSGIHSRLFVVFLCWYSIPQYSIITEGVQLCSDDRRELYLGAFNSLIENLFGDPQRSVYSIKVKRGHWHCDKHASKLSVRDTVVTAHTLMMAGYELSIMEGKHLEYPTIFNYENVNFLETYFRHSLVFWKFNLTIV